MNDVVVALMKVIGSGHTELDSLLNAAHLVGIDQAQLRQDLMQVVAERIFMALVGRRIDNSLTYRHRKRKITKHLTVSGGCLHGYSPQLVDELADSIATSQVRIGEALSEKKDGINTISSSEQDSLLKLQGCRCKVCGVPLDASVRGTSDGRFDGGLEPLEKPVLDHAWPFYVGGNTRNLQLLCKGCNELKNDLIGVQEDGLVFSGNHLRPRGLGKRDRRVMLWTLWAQEQCRGCGATARDSILWVAPKERGLAQAYGHLDVFCSKHAPATAVYIHRDNTKGTRERKRRSRL